MFAEISYRKFLSSQNTAKSMWDPWLIKQQLCEVLSVDFLWLGLQNVPQKLLCGTAFNYPKVLQINHPRVLKALWRKEKKYQ